MFYFGAFWKNVNMEHLIHLPAHMIWSIGQMGRGRFSFPSEEYDRRYAHKSYVIKWNGIVYHFYCAVNENKQRGIALATSQNLGKSSISFPIFEKN